MTSRRRLEMQWMMSRHRFGYMRAEQHIYDSLTIRDSAEARAAWERAEAIFKRQRAEVREFLTPAWERVAGRWARRLIGVRVAARTVQALIKRPLP